jgi:hypothetical protein
MATLGEDTRALLNEAGLTDEAAKPPAAAAK